MTTMELVPTPRLYQETPQYPIIALLKANHLRSALRHTGSKFAGVHSASDPS